MDQAEYIPRIRRMVREAEDYRDDLSQDRITAIQYYDGVMTDTPADEGRSKVVSRDVRAIIKKVIPSIVRTILGNDEVVEFAPMGEGDEEMAQQASDYINYVILPESGGYDAIYDAIHDATRLRNGVLTWWYEEKTEAKVSRHTGLLPDQFAELVNDDDVEVLEHTERPDEIVIEEVAQPIIVHDVKIKRLVTKRCPRIACRPLDEFLIHPDAIDEHDAPIVGTKIRLRRTDLVAMGYDKEKVEKLPFNDKDEDEESERRGDNFQFDTEEEHDSALQEVDYYELFVRVDTDGDGIAELRRMCFGGAVNELGLLKDEECDEVQLCTIACERKPHQWEGVSVADDVMEIQRVKTVLLRQTLDNLYWQNNPQPVVQEGHIVNMDAVMNPEFGMPIRVKKGTPVGDAYQVNTVPFVANESYSMLEYMDNEAQDRTGITDASSGMAPDALQNMTAKASAMIEAAGIGQTEQIVRTIANDLKPLFKGVLRMIIRHQDAPRTVRLRDEWVTYDPQHWDAEMDVTVNTGLGAGTRERDMMMMQMIIGLQERIVAALGADNPFVKEDNLYNAATKLVESAGLKTPGLYITEPDPQEVEARKAAAAQNDPEAQKLAFEQQKHQAELAMKAREAEQTAVMEAQKSERDFAMRERELEMNHAARLREIELEDARKREQMAGEFQLKEQQIALEAAVKANTQDVRMGGEPG